MLDWKTYMNAARKRYIQGKDGNANDLESHATMQFRKKHLNPDNQWSDRYGERTGSQYNSLYGDVNILNGHMQDSRKKRDDKDVSYSPVYRYGYIGPTGNIPREKMFSQKNDVTVQRNPKYNTASADDMNDVSSRYSKKKQDMGNDLNGYYNGGAEYIDGKGWNM